MSLRAEFVNPFVESASDIVQQVTGLSSKRGRLRLKDRNHPFRDVCVILGIVGKVHGQVIYGMDEATAKTMVSKMMMGAEVIELDEMAKSALGELGNMITGKASVGLEEAGFTVNISPPTLVTAKNLQISSLKIAMLVVPLETSEGVIDIYVGLTDEQPD